MYEGWLSGSAIGRLGFLDCALELRWPQSITNLREGVVLKEDEKKSVGIDHVRGVICRDVTSGAPIVDLISVPQSYLDCISFPPSPKSVKLLDAKKKTTKQMAVRAIIPFQI
jgi:hypothetical protein